MKMTKEQIRAVQEAAELFAQARDAATAGAGKIAVFKGPLFDMFAKIAMKAADDMPCDPRPCMRGPRTMCDRSKDSPTVEDCIFCGRPMIVPPGGDAICEACRREQVKAEAEVIILDALRLLDGQPPFDMLTDDEWREQVDALRPDAAPCVEMLGDDQLIAAVADPADCVLPGDAADDVTAVAAGEILRRLGAFERIAPIAGRTRATA